MPISFDRNVLTESFDRNVLTESFDRNVLTEFSFWTHILNLGVGGGA